MAQKALWLPKTGADFTLGVNEIPEPGPGEILVKLEATALNPIDWVIQKEGFFLVKDYPVIIGENGSGVVAKVGAGVSHLTTGDRVTFASPFQAKQGGTYQQYCLADAELASKVPDNVSFDEAAPITSCLSPFAVATYAQKPRGMAFTPPVEPGGLGKYTNQPILIMGGTTSLGQYGIQLAKLSGFNPIITTASLEYKDLLVSLGATHVLDRKSSAGALKDQVAHITKTPISYAFDAVSAEATQQAAYDLLAPGGTLAVVTQELVNADVGSGKQVLMVYGSFEIPENRALGARFATALTAWLEEGTVKAGAVEVLEGGLGGIAGGLRRLEAGGVSAKKLVVRPQETRV